MQKAVTENMSDDSKTKSFLPLHPSSSDEDESSKKSPVPMRNKVAIYASQIAQSSGTTSNISLVPTMHNKVMMNNMTTMSQYGQLTPAPGRLTPTGQGRIKAPPVGSAMLKRVASSIDDFNTEGVCFSPKEADSCAEKALLRDSEGSGDGRTRGGGGGVNLKDMPLNVENRDASTSWKNHQAEKQLAFLAEGRTHVSSSSTVITTSSAGSCCKSIMGSEFAAIAGAMAVRGPPLEVVRTDLLAASEDELAEGNVLHVTKTPKPTAKSSSLLPNSSGSLALSSTFTNNLIKENSSRQGRSLQRWLVHSPTEELVRQVAGTIPITRDGRIILVSASRKSEWILPKGGWDADETKEECAARETFEEGGLLGRLGGCLEPIDYETRKGKKRRLGQILEGDPAGQNGKKVEGNGKSKTDDGERNEEGTGMLSPLPKRVKMDKATTPMISTVTASTLKSESSKSTTPVGDNKALLSLSKPAATTPVNPKKHSYVRLFLFPLYVSTVKSDWPEKGRLRKLVDIDEAIKIMEAENRQYFKRGLEMVKERGLHLVKPESGLK